MTGICTRQIGSEKVPLPNIMPVIRECISPIKTFMAIQGSRMEKRIYPRVRKLYLVSYVIESEGRGHSPVSMGRTLDISPSGIRMEVYQLLTIDSIIELEIGIAEDRFTVRGKVVRVKQVDERAYSIGIEFDEPQIGLGYGLEAEGPWDNPP